MRTINDKIKAAIAPLIGRECCRSQASCEGSLSLGFGEKVFHKNKRLVDDFYGEWEIGTYYGAWRIIQDGKIIIGSNSIAEDSIGELNRILKQFNFGRFAALTALTDIDIRVELDNSVCIDFFAMASDEDEIFHIFCPGSEYVEFSIRNGWKLGKSNEPWK
jgi:hypothetical protein